MRLYHNPLSFNARRAVMAAHELREDVDLVLVDLGKGEQRKPEFLAMNPNGKVPVLDDDGFYLTESHAIMQYLADKTPGQTLYPKELRARADVNRWLFWSAHEFTPSVAILNWEHLVKRFLSLGDPEPVLVARGNERVAACARVLDGHLQKRTWIAGEALSLADLAIATPLANIEPAKLPVKDCRHVLGWLERVQARDSWKKSAM